MTTDGWEQRLDDLGQARGTAYGSGSPTYENAELQRLAIQGRVELARRWAVRYSDSGDQRRAAKWNRIADELLDRLLEVRGR